MNNAPESGPCYYCGGTTTRVTDIGIPATDEIRRAFVCAADDARAARSTLNVISARRGW